MIIETYTTKNIPEDVKEEGLYVYGAAWEGQIISKTCLAPCIISFFDRSAKRRTFLKEEISLHWKIKEPQFLEKLDDSCPHYILIALSRASSFIVCVDLEKIPVNFKVILLDYEEIEDCKQLYIWGKEYPFSSEYWNSKIKLPVDYSYDGRGNAADLNSDCHTHTPQNKIDDLKKRLQAEEDFFHYVDLLQEAQENHLCILMGSSGTPCGKKLAFTAEAGEKLQSLGLQTNLYDKYEYSYIAMFVGKTLAKERCSNHEEISETILLENTEVTMISNSNYLPNEPVHHCQLFLNENPIKDSGRNGLRIIVLNQEQCEILDDVLVNSDETLIELLRLPEIASVKIEELISNHPDITFFDYALPRPSFNKLNYYGRYILSEGMVDNLERLQDSPLSAETVFSYVDSPEDIAVLTSQPPLYRGLDGARYYEEFHSKFLNCANGHRVTTDQPDFFERTIYIVGACINAGVGVRDQYTFASCLQRLLNANARDEHFLVENAASGIYFLNEQEELLATLQALPLKPGDIVIGIGEMLCPYSKEYDVRPCKYGEVFLELNHPAEGGHRLVADALFETLKEHDFFRDTVSYETGECSQRRKKERGQTKTISAEDAPELAAYQERLTKLWEGSFHRSQHVGAIVMNCNPFTLGHRYLIEHASKQCEYLLIFVVQEDRSFFPFADRLRLVKEGTKDLKNVVVMESGKFIISTMTFEGYFNKQKLQDRTVDSNKDVMIFAQEIAPATHIEKRFVGTEPFDTVTQQYNRTLKRVLPYYGVDVEEIERKNCDGLAISASNVRKLLEEKNWTEIRKLVPDTTYAYLQEKFS